MVAGYREPLQMKIRLIGEARFELTTSSSSTGPVLTRQVLPECCHQKLCHNSGSLHLFENRRALGETQKLRHC
jgi:hypothetical protein